MIVTVQRIHEVESICLQTNMLGEKLTQSYRGAERLLPNLSYVASLSDIWTINFMQSSFELISRLSDVQKRRPTYLALGSFDGVHLGHQELLSNLVTSARESNARSAVLTFFPHPRRVIQQLSDRFYITTVEDRLTLLREAGVDLVINHPFDEQVRQMRAAHFVDRLLTALDMRQLWGGNFAFGYQREGTIPFLQNLGTERGFSVAAMESMVVWDGELVSSSRIRRSLGQGDISDVNGCLFC